MAAVPLAAMQGAGLALMAINSLVGTGFQIWQQSRQIYGDQIPSWEAIVQDNQKLQAKIDAEKTPTGIRSPNQERKEEAGQ